MIRNAFLKRVESVLETLDEEIDRIAAKSEKVDADVRIRYDEEITALRRKQELVRMKIREVRDAGAASWGELKSGVQDATDELEKAIERAVDRLKKSA